MTFSVLFRRMRPYFRAESGVAAIEFAVILPFMLLLYFGLLDLTGLITSNRRMTSTAAIVADLTGQNRTTVAKATIEDYMLVAGMINNPAPDSGVRVNVLGFRNNAGTVEPTFNVTTAGGPACDAPDTGDMLDLMTAGNDIIVAQSCMIYVPYVATFLGDALLGATSFNVQQEVMVRPRSTAVLDCPDC